MDFARPAEIVKARTPIAPLLREAGDAFRAEQPEDGRLVLAVENDGTAIPAEALPRGVEPVVTPRRGAGRRRGGGHRTLGQHPGPPHGRSAPGEGTRSTISLPARRLSRSGAGRPVVEVGLRPPGPCGSTAPGAVRPRRVARVRATACAALREPPRVHHAALHGGREDGDAPRPSAASGPRAAGTVMHNTANVEVIRRCYEAFEKGDIATILASIGPNVDWEVVGIGNRLPFGGRRQSLNEVKSFFKAVDDTSDFDTYMPAEILSDGDRVIATGRAIGTVKANGNRIETDWVHLFRLKDGKIVHFREHTDTAALLEAFGVHTGIAPAAGTRPRPGTTPH